MSKEKIEENKYTKISVPIINDAELNYIDNHIEELVNMFTKQVVHEKELIIAQHIIKRQKQNIEQLENKIKIQRKKERKIKKYCNCESTFRCFDNASLERTLEKYVNRTKREILEILEE